MIEPITMEEVNKLMQQRENELNVDEQIEEVNRAIKKAVRNYDGTIRVDMPNEGVALKIEHIFEKKGFDIESYYDKQFAKIRYWVRIILQEEL